MRTFPFLSLVFMLAQMYAQPFQITFTGSGLSNTVTTVEVQNLTQGTTLTLNGSDILELVTNIGISDVSMTHGEILIYPNPAESSCRMEFFNKQAGDVCIELFDAAGKLLLQNEDYLTQGGHSYDLSGLNSGMYVLKVNTPASTYSVKIISTGIAEGLPLLGYAGGNSQTVHNFRLASTTGTIQMQYNAGEMLLFKGISGNYARVITFLPTQNWSINFEFIASSDADGNHYPVVTIGTQTWMAENLKTTKYSNGDPVLNVTDSSDWTNLTTTGAYCWYNNDEATYAATYGALYNWYAVNNTKGLCPTGWHVPTVAEWATLSDFLGGQNVAGGHLKETGTTHWNSPNAGATNSSAFTGLPGGYRYDNTGVYGLLGENGSWWTSTANSTSEAWRRLLYYLDSTIYKDSFNKKGGRSVRCVLIVPPSYPPGTVHCDPSNPTAIVDVTNPTTGKIWMDRNLGAAQVATSSTDAAAYGDLYQWGRFADGHQCRTSGTTTNLSSSDVPGHGNFILAPNTPYDWRSPQNDNLWQGVNGVNNPCPTGYRLPTEAELDAERLSSSSNNSAGAFASPLKLPVAGGHNGSNGSLNNVGSNGHYWSSTVSGAYSRGLDFYSTAANMGSYYRAHGLSVRCFKD